jgi:peptidyl-tRNA hydrolase
MSAGKMGAQIAHATRLSLLRYLKYNPDRSEEFIALNSCGSAVTLQADRLRDLERARDEAERAGLPWALFTDSGHIMPPHFDGSPVTTVLSIGPAPRAAMRAITRRFRCA